MASFNVFNLLRTIIKLAEDNILLYEKVLITC